MSDDIGMSPTGHGEGPPSDTNKCSTRDRWVVAPVVRGPDRGGLGRRSVGGWVGDCQASARMNDITCEESPSSTAGFTPMAWSTVVTV